MINIIETLGIGSYYKGNDFIKIAKGKYELPLTIGELYLKLKRYFTEKLIKIING